MNRLDEILRAKRTQIELLRPRRAELEAEAIARSDFRTFRGALQRADQKLAVIAEIKRASPSAGVIAHSFNPIEIAKQYEFRGASAISVLTETKFFRGDLEHLADGHFARNRIPARTRGAMLGAAGAATSRRERAKTCMPE